MENAAQTAQSILLAEVCGSVRLLERLGAEEAQRAVERCIKRMERAAEAFGGQVRKQSGGELMATFSTIDDTLHAANEMRLKVADLPPVSGVKLDIRVGFAQGSIEENNGEWTGDALKIAATLTGLADPGEILTDAASQQALSAHLQPLTRDRGVFPARSQFAQARICEVLAPSTHVSDTPVAGPAHEQQRHLSSRLRLSYGEQTFTLDKARPTLSMGRGPDNDLVIDSHRVSRHHAKIEKREADFVLIDSSTNGSYLTPDGVPGIRLLRNECPIQGKGIISFATRATDVDAVCVTYELIYT